MENWKKGAIMTAIRCLQTGLIYRNPKPHVCSVHAYFPSVVVLDNGELLATLVLGEAFEAPNLRTWVVRSADLGETWHLEGTIYPGTVDRLTSDGCRITALPGGEVVAFMVRHDRTEHPDEGLTNHQTLGFVPTELLLLRSQDYGRAWTEPQAFTPPLVGPSFELCCPITPLQDRRWLLPTSTWRGWDGNCPNGMKMVALVSHNQGKSWPEYLDVMADPQQHVVYWESKIIELPDRRLLATAWAYNEAAAQDLPNQYALSKDGGRSWTVPCSTGLQGQTLTPFLLKDSRILCVYRRMDEAGLWANLSHLKGDQWGNESCAPLWGTQVAGLTGSSNNMAQNFNVLKFGAPCVTGLPDGTIFVAFWCYEDCVSNIRWFKLRVD
ncbi:exo-alpha-sialidase [Candidatus Poribacteria bacterium]|nr:exo-alpha-sialidase [Candidatus Poribacteria bacterium]